MPSRRGICEGCGRECYLQRDHLLEPEHPDYRKPENIVECCPTCHNERHMGQPGGHSRGRGHTPEARAKRSASFKRLWADPDYRAHQVAKRKAAGKDPEVQRRKGEAIRRFHAAEGVDPAERERREKLNEERKRRISETKKARYADNPTYGRLTPEAAEKRREKMRAAHAAQTPEQKAEIRRKIAATKAARRAADPNYGKRGKK